MGGLSHFMKDRRANSATEFAFILPVMLTFMAGIVEFGRWFQAYDGVNRLASRYASVYADCNDNPNNVSPTPQACNTELGLYWPAAAIKNIAPQLASGLVTVRMFDVQYSGTGAQTILYQYPSSISMTAGETSAAINAIFYGGSQHSGSVVTIQYTYSPLFFTALFKQLAPNNNQPYAISYTVAQRSN